MAVWLSMTLSQGTPNETARTNTVTASVRVHYSGGSFNGNSPSGTLTIDGQSFSFTCNFNYSGIGQGAASTGTGSVTACTRTVTVSYGSSSTRTVSASASFASGTASGTVTASDSITLTSISAGGSSGGGDDDDNTGEGGSGSGTVTPPSNVGNCTIVGQYWFSSDSETLNYNNAADFTLNNGDYLPQHVALKFTTPRFSGASTSLVVNLSSTELHYANDLPVCFALCNSDENFGMYVLGPSVVNDPNQIAYGSLTRAEWLSMPFTIQTNELSGNTDYYLIFWIPSDYGLYGNVSAAKAPYHGITVNYEGGSDISPEEYTISINAGSGCNINVIRNDVMLSLTDGDSINDGDFLTITFSAFPGYSILTHTINGSDFDSGYVHVVNGDVVIVVTAEPDSGSGGDVVHLTARGVFYIDNGTEYTAYQCYIDNGTSWDPVGYARASGEVNIESGAATVTCNFKPDAVVLTGLSYESSDGSWELQMTAVFTEKTMSYPLTVVAYNNTYDWLEATFEQTDTGFSVSEFSFYEDGYYTTVDSMSLNYVAIKYT